MKSPLVWLGFATFLVAVLVVLPARWGAAVLPSSLQCASWSGSIWHGQCTGLTVTQPGSPPLLVQTLRWQLQPAALLRLKVRAQADVHTEQGSGSGQIELGRKGLLNLRDVTVTTQFDRQLATMLAPGWVGQLQANQLAMRLQGKQLQALSGVLELRDFNDGKGGALGSYRLEFPAHAGPPFIGQLQDAGGPLEVKATLAISTERRWQLEGVIAARPAAADALRRRLDILGPPDSNGRYRLAAEGSFK